MWRNRTRDPGRRAATVTMSTPSRRRECMTHRIRTIAAVAATGLISLAVPGLPAAHASHPVGRAAAPVVVAKMTHTQLTLSDTNVRAGRITFEATAKKGDHIFQLLKLHTGYTAQQAFTDVALAFKGDTDAIARIDKNITWLGGAEAKPGAPGWYQINLKAGQYAAVDQNGNGFAQFRVTGSTQKRTAQATQGTITTFSYGFRSDGKLQAKGWIKATNRADQPHFIELQHVKTGTTRNQIAKFFAKGGNGKPPWALPGSTGLGVISPGKTVAWNLNLPKGEYVMMCFWPDLFTGMPHVAMGMFDLTTLS
jgi:hypothetical protein